MDTDTRCDCSRVSTVGAGRRGQPKPVRAIEREYERSTVTNRRPLIRPDSNR